MQYGHFDDEAKEYVITRPDTPQSWSNYLGTTEYGAIITNNAGGYSFYKSGAQGRFLRMRLNSVPMDQPGRYFYLRDQASGDYWSVSWQPVGKPLDQFKSTCRHGTAYTIVSSEYAEIAAEATYFVPLDQGSQVLERLVVQDCGSCHGLSLKGGLGPDLRSNSLEHYDANVLTDVILDGIPGTAMPPWRPLISEEEAEWIAHYLLEQEEQ